MYIVGYFSHLLQLPKEVVVTEATPYLMELVFCFLFCFYPYVTAEVAGAIKPPPHINRRSHLHENTFRT